MQANKSHSSLQHRATGGGITTPVLIQTHLCSKPQLPMISFISLQNPSPAALRLTQRTLSKHQPQKKGDERERAHIFRKCCSVQSCGKLVLLQFPILVCSASLCHCITLVDFDGGKRKDEARISLMLLINKRQREEHAIWCWMSCRPSAPSAAVNYLWRFPISHRNGQGLHLLSCRLHGH